MTVADAELLLRQACMSAPLFIKMQGVMLWEPVSFSRVCAEVNREGVMLKGVLDWCSQVSLQSIRMLLNSWQACYTPSLEQCKHFNFGVNILHLPVECAAPVSWRTHTLSPPHL